jgi:xanthine dehydrogenase YagT iron-sulfur-binding subunit
MDITFKRRDIVASAGGKGGTVSLLTNHGGAVALPSPGVPIHTILRIDGRERRVLHDIRESLLDTLSAEVGHAGTRKGCDHGQCGACAVHIDGQPKLSCRTLTVALQGADITTACAPAAGASASSSAGRSVASPPER